MISQFDAENLLNHRPRALHVKALLTGDRLSLANPGDCGCCRSSIFFLLEYYEMPAHYDKQGEFRKRESERLQLA